MYSFSDDDFAKVGTYLDNLKRFFAKRVQYKFTPSYESAFTEDKASVNPDLFYNWQLGDLALMVVCKDGKYRLRSFGFKFGVKSENELFFLRRIIRLIMKIRLSRRIILRNSIRLMIVFAVFLMLVVSYSQIS